MPRMPHPAALAAGAPRAPEVRPRPSFVRLLHLLPIPAAVLSPGSRFLAANQHLCRLFACPDLAGKDLGSMDELPGGAHLASLVESVVETGEVTSARGVETDDRQSFDVVLHPLSTPRDPTTYVLLLMHDVSPWTGSLAKTLQESKHKDDFIALLAHELRNPLAPIQAAVELVTALDDEDIAPPLRTAMGVIERQLNLLSRLVDDLLDVARVSRGRIEINRRRTALSDVVQRAVETARPLIEARQHELELHVVDENLVLHADPARISQVVANLLNNAAKYTDEGGRIELVVQRRGDEALLSVTDNGIGIERDALPTVFDTFAQASRARERSRGGLGLGLALVRGIVELHGGSVEAHSEGAGTGSTFVVRVPLAQGGERPSQPRHPSPPPSERGERVLVVDDNVDAAEMLAAALRTRCYRVQTAYTGSDALELVERFDPEVILLDLGLPDIDGFEVARQVRDSKGGMPHIIAVTGFGDATSRRKSAAAGFDAHMLKPVDLERLETLFARMRE